MYDFVSMEILKSDDDVGEEEFGLFFVEILPVS